MLANGEADYAWQGVDSARRSGRERDPVCPAGEYRKGDSVGGDGMRGTVPGDTDGDPIGVRDSRLMLLSLAELGAAAVMRMLRYFMWRAFQASISTRDGDADGLYFDRWRWAR